MHAHKDTRWPLWGLERPTGRSLLFAGHDAGSEGRLERPAGPISNLQDSMGQRREQGVARALSRHTNTPARLLLACFMCRVWYVCCAQRRVSENKSGRGVRTPSFEA
jgi:hypothetical protein